MCVCVCVCCGGVVKRRQVGKSSVSGFVYTQARAVLAVYSYEVVQSWVIYELCVSSTQ